jgi:hypothetical protein
MKKSEFVEIVQDLFEEDLERNHASDRFEHSYKKRDGAPCLIIKDEETGRKITADLTEEYGDGKWTRQQVRDIYDNAIHDRLYQFLVVEAQIPEFSHHSSVDHNLSVTVSGFSGPEIPEDDYLDAILDATNEYDAAVQEEIMDQVLQALNRVYTELAFERTDDPWTIRCAADNIFPPFRMNLGKLAEHMEDFSNHALWDSCMHETLIAIDQTLIERMGYLRGDIFLHDSPTKRYPAFDNSGRITDLYVDSMGHARDASMQPGEWVSVEDISTRAIPTPCPGVALLTHDGYPGAVGYDGIRDILNYNVFGADAPPAGLDRDNAAENIYLFPFSKYVTEVVMGVESPQAYLDEMEQKYAMTPEWERLTGTIFQYNYNTRDIRMVSREFFIDHVQRIEPMEHTEDTPENTPEEEVEIEFEF